MARIINSPGVQISEQDLSLRIETPVGTQIYIPGFSSQGPTAEPIMITSVSELETIFGLPTNAAEKYFYYSCKEILNSPGVLNAIRLPYGSNNGESFSNAYSALLYPVVSSNDAFTVHAPEHVQMSQETYNKVMQGNFTWSLVSNSTSVSLLTSTGNNPVVINAGFVVLNDLQTTINEQGEGYYIGFVDNKAADNADFDSIAKVNTIIAEKYETSVFTEISSARLEFALTSTAAEAANGVTSVSEALEKVGFIGFNDTEYNDYLSFGVFKLRKSTSNNQLLSLSVAEYYLGSLDERRMQINQTGVLANAYLGQQISTKSPVIKFLGNPNFVQSGWANIAGTGPTKRVSVDTTAKALFPVGAYTTVTSTMTSAKVIGNVTSKVEKVLRIIENPEDTVVDVVVDGGLSTIAALASGSATFVDSKFIVDPSVSAVNNSWKSVANLLTNFAQNTRQDCIAIVDPPRYAFIQGPDTKVTVPQGKSFTTEIYNVLKTCFGSFQTSYAATYANWVKQLDSFAGTEMWIPFSGYAAAIFAKSDAIGNTWAAPAGFNRGNFSNVLDIAFNPNQKQRDRLYEIACNPVGFFSGDGYAIFGQKTLQTKPTSFDRINVRRLFLTLERAVQKTVRYFVFEPNTEFTRKRLKDTISPLFNYAKASQGIYDYMIVCDERNNTPNSIDNNELIVDIYIKPVRTAEFILVNFIATRTSQNFQELI